MHEANLTPQPPEPALSTQSAHPGRASARTLVQNVLGYLIAGGIVIGTTAAILSEELGEYLPPGVLGVLAIIAAIATAVSTIAARIMAIPTVDSWLASHKVTRGLSSRPPS